MSQQHCSYCGVAGKDQRLRRCTSCKIDSYCSKTCQVEHWPKHKEQCNQHTNPQANQCSHTKTNNTSTKKEDSQSHLVALVGKWCIVECYIQGRRTRALWDTGSQVCIVDEKWKNKHLPHEKLRGVSELLDAPNDLQVTAANGQSMPYKGFIVHIHYWISCRGIWPQGTCCPHARDQRSASLTAQL